jgi:hypothetical protein
MLRKFWFVIVIVIVGLACNVSMPKGGSSAGEATPEAAQVVEPGAEVVQPAVEKEEQAPVESPTETPVPTPTTVPSKPVGLWEGLSSLNSYRLTIRTTANGPKAQDKSMMTYLTEVGSDGDSSHIHSENFSSSEDDPEGSNSTSDQYRVGNQTCELNSDDDEVSVTDEDPMVQEMLNTWVKLVDLVPMVQDPVFAGEEELNGIKTNHFTFTVSGLGVESGAEVVSSGGDYWLAQDGQYIVKYSALLETRNGPAGTADTETMSVEFYIELKDANQNIVITMPDQCQ